MLTPVLASLSGDQVPSAVWVACIVALVGSTLVAFDGSQLPASEAPAGEVQPSSISNPVTFDPGEAASTSDIASLTNSAGDASAAGALSGFEGEFYILAACAFWALTTVRLSRHAPRFNSIDLAFVKVLTLALLSVGWLVSDALTGPGSIENGSSFQMAVQSTADAGSGSLNAASATSWIQAAAAQTSTAQSGDFKGHIQSLIQRAQGALAALQIPQGLNNPFGLGLLAYSAVGPGAFATFLQAKGQAETPAAQAQVIYSSTPIWSAVIAHFTLSGEVSGPLTWGGGVLILLAGLQVARQSEVLTGDSSSSDRAA